MAEFVSLFAAALGVLDVAVRASARLRDLAQSWRDADSLISALANETADLGLVLDQIRQAGLKTFKSRNAQHSKSLLVVLGGHIGKATSLLTELDVLVDYLNQGDSTVRRNKWVLKRGGPRGCKKSSGTCVRQLKSC
jgi:hypothetical protein